MGLFSTTDGSIGIATDTKLCLLSEKLAEQSTDTLSDDGDLFDQAVVIEDQTTTIQDDPKRLSLQCVYECQLGEEIVSLTPVCIQARRYLAILICTAVTSESKICLVDASSFEAHVLTEIDRADWLYAVKRDRLRPTFSDQLSPSNCDVCIVLGHERSTPCFVVSLDVRGTNVPSDIGCQIHSVKSYSPISSPVDVFLDWQRHSGLDGKWVNVSHANLIALFDSIANVDRSLAAATSDAASLNLDFDDLPDLSLSDSDCDENVQTDNALIDELLTSIRRDRIRQIESIVFNGQLVFIVLDGLTLTLRLFRCPTSDGSMVSTDDVGGVTHVCEFVVVYPRLYVLTVLGCVYTLNLHTDVRWECQKLPNFDQELTRFESLMLDVERCDLIEGQLNQTMYNIENWKKVKAAHKAFDVNLTVGSGDRSLSLRITNQSGETLCGNSISVIARCRPVTTGGRYLLPKCNQIWCQDSCPLPLHFGPSELVDMPMSDQVDFGLIFHTWNVQVTVHLLFVWTHRGETFCDTIAIGPAMLTSTSLARVNLKLTNVRRSADITYRDVLHANQKFVPVEAKYLYMRHERLASQVERVAKFSTLWQTGPQFQARKLINRIDISCDSPSLIVGHLPHAVVDNSVVCAATVLSVHDEWHYWSVRLDVIRSIGLGAITSLDETSQLVASAVVRPSDWPLLMVFGHSRQGQFVSITVFSLCQCLAADIQDAFVTLKLEYAERLRECGMKSLIVLPERQRPLPISNDPDHVAFEVKRQLCSCPLHDGDIVT